MASKVSEITGVVLFADGSPAAALGVQAFDWHVTSRRLVGGSKTAPDGTYRIEYPAEAIMAGDDVVDLVVEARDTSGTVLGTSGVYYNAPQQAVVDLTIPLRPDSTSRWVLAAVLVIVLLVGGLRWIKSSMNRRPR
jgi:hypothetical protein